MKAHTCIRKDYVWFDYTKGVKSQFHQTSHFGPTPKLISTSMYPTAPDFSSFFFSFFFFFWKQKWGSSDLSHVRWIYYNYNYKYSIHYSNIFIKLGQENHQIIPHSYFIITTYNHLHTQPLSYTCLITWLWTSTIICKSSLKVSQL